MDDFGVPPILGNQGYQSTYNWDELSYLLRRMSHQVWVENVDTTGLKGRPAVETVTFDMKYGWAPVNIPKNDSRKHWTQKRCPFLGTKASTFEKQIDIGQGSNSRAFRKRDVGRLWK